MEGMEGFESLFKIVPASGSIFNAITIILGSAVGLSVGRYIPTRVTQPLIKAIGMFIVYLGISMALEESRPLVMLGSLAAGTAVGELVGIDAAAVRLGELLKSRFRMRDERFVDAFVNASMIFCIGSLAVLGSIEDGLGAFPTLLVTKSTIDGISSAVFSTTLGIGTMFSSIPVFIYQAAMTLGASWLHGAVTPEVMASVSGVGGLMLACMGLSMMGAVEIKTANQIPSLIFAAILGGAC